MTDARRLALYVGTCLAVAVAPGPDNCFVLAQAAAFGAWAGLAVTAGLVTGLCVHMALAALGVAALLDRWPRAADAVAALGAGYLLYVAWGMWGAGLASAEAEALSPAGFWLRGVALNLSNPKVILFFVAFLPKFLPAGCVHRAWGLLGLGALFAACAATVMGAFALAGGGLAALLRGSPAVATWVGRGAAIAVAAIALWIVAGLLGKRRAPKDAQA